ncbi:EF-hand domain-containing protein [Brevundimonas sp.]|uniref:EF-hand domain-containing protein n=1 Tax=Brevundimonas sp. TaxID=1871086 RepID=UPI003569FBA2
MKTSYLTSVLTAVALGGVLIAGGVAMAQQSTQDRPARGMRADADADGRLNQAEFVASSVQRLSTADANRDGTVAPGEMRSAARTRMADRADGRFERLDGDDDGMISRAEFDASRAARAQGGPRANNEGRRGQRDERLPVRMDARAPVVIAEARTKAEQAFARMDANGDGFVVAEERRAFGEQRRERMSERRAARQARQASPSTPASE